MLHNVKDSKMKTLQKQNSIGLKIVNDPTLNAISKKNEEIESTFEHNQTYLFLDKVCDLASAWGCKLNGTKEVS